MKKFQSDNGQVFFTNEYLQIGEDRYYYDRISNIGHQSSEPPRFVFDYDGSAVSFSHREKDKNELLMYFKKAMITQMQAEKEPTAEPAEVNGTVDSYVIDVSVPEYEGYQGTVPRRKKKWPIILIAALILGLIAFGVFGLRSCSSPKSPIVCGSAIIDGTLFVNGVYEDENATVKILKTEVIPPGSTKYNEFSFEDRPVFAIWYEVTSKTGDETVSPFYWATEFTAYQKNELSASSLPDEKYLNTPTDTLKKGQTVDYCVGYLLEDETTPVMVKPWIVFDGPEKSSTFEIQ